MLVTVNKVLLLFARGLAFFLSRARVYKLIVVNFSIVLSILSISFALRRFYRSRSIDSRLKDYLYFRDEISFRSRFFYSFHLLTILLPFE